MRRSSICLLWWGKQIGVRFHEMNEVEFEENGDTYVQTLKHKAVASRHRADLHVERVPLVVELHNAAERMHDLHFLQCQKAVMS